MIKEEIERKVAALWTVRDLARYFKVSEITARRYGLRPAMQQAKVKLSKRCVRFDPEAVRKIVMGGK